MAIILGRKPGGGGGGGAPSGPAGGDLAGTYPNPTIDPTAAVISVDGGGGQLAGNVTLSAGTNITLTQVAQDIEIAAAAAETDPVFELLGTPDTAFEFDSSSLAGLTGFGTPDAENADTTVPGAYYILDDDNAYAGRYVGATPPFTVVTKMLDKLMVAVDGYKAGLFISDASPSFAGDADVILHGNANQHVWVEDAGVANITSAPYAAMPLYFAIRVNASNNCDFLYSANGWIWYKIVDSRDPGYTVANCGLTIIGAASLMAAAFDYLRIWNSAKSFPGALA